MELYSHPEISIILDCNPKNQKCFDCGNPHPRWTSIYHGIFLCLKCAGRHRYQDLKLSTILSLLVDQWDESRLLALSLGGNEKYEAFLNEYNLLHSKFEGKYLTKAALYYRKQLRVQIKKALNQELNESEIELVKPSVEEGRQVISEQEMKNEFLPPKPKIDSQDTEKEKEKTEENKEKPTGKMFGFDGSFFKNVGQKVASTSTKFAGDFTQKVKGLNLTEKIKETGKKTVEYAKNTGTYINTKAQEVYVIININNLPI